MKVETFWRSDNSVQTTPVKALRERERSRADGSVEWSDCLRRNSHAEHGASKAVKIRTRGGNDGNSTTDRRVIGPIPFV